MKIIITIENECEACAIEEAILDAEDSDQFDFAFKMERQFDSACEIADKERAK